MSEYHPSLYSYSSNPTSQPYPHGVYPYPPSLSSYPVNGGHQMAYPAEIQGSQTWATGQAIQSVTENPGSIIGPRAPQMGHCAYQSMLKVPKKKKNKPKKKRKRNLSNMNQSVRCELCDIYCNSIVLYEMHLAGKKHLKTLQKKYASSAALSPPTSQPVVGGSSSVPTSSMVGNSIQGTPSGPIVEDLGRKKQKLVDGGAANSARICNACNVLCNSEKTFATHCAGKRHRKQEMAITGLKKHGMEGASHVSVAEDLDASNEKIMVGGVVHESENACLSSKDGCSNNVSLPDDVAGKDSNAQAPTTSTVGWQVKNIDSGVAVAEGSARLCTTRNIICNSELSLDGKKHATEEMAITSAGEHGTGAASSVSIPKDLDASDEKIMESRAVEESKNACMSSDDRCNNDVPLPDNIAGKDNIAQESATSIVFGHDSSGDSGVAVGLDPGSKRMKLMHAEVTERSARLCATCNIVCNSEVAFADHIAGKKHATQVRKASTGSSTCSKPKPLTTKNPVGDSEEKGQKVEGSGPPSTATRVCDVCKVVCNSDTVMKTHLAGKKHASTVKKLVVTSMPVSTTT